MAISDHEKKARGSWSETLVVLNHFANLQSLWFFGEAQHVNMISITNYTESVIVTVYQIVYAFHRMNTWLLLRAHVCEDSFWSPKWSSWTSLSAFWTTLRSVRQFKHFETPFEAISIISKCFEALHEAILSILKQLIKQFRKHLKVFWNRCKSRSNQVT